jgi:hypothetical protein
MAEATPKTIGRYEIVRELGRGMMGIVYEARDPVLGRTVAVKTIQLAFAIAPEQRPEFEERFFTEARVAARLSHPGIVVCHDMGKDEETASLYIVLEHLKGRTLSDIIRGGHRLPWREVLRIVASVARALDHAHGHGVVHRDMKPANVMVLENGEVKILDFGISKVETARIQFTAAGQFFGTPLYMSPEQALGDPVDGRTDIFSLGTITCTLALGHPPFAADSIPAILGRVAQAERPVLAREVPGVPPDVDRILGLAMAREPEDRYAHARQMAEDIEDVLADRAPRHASPASDPTLVPDLTQLVDDPMPASAAPPVRPRRSGVLLVVAGVAGVVLMSLLIVIYIGVRALRSVGDPTPPTVAGEPGAGPVTDEAPELPTERSPTLPPLDESPPPVQGPEGSARVDVVFEHGLKDGALRVWVDDAPMLDQAVSARATKKVLVTVREGRFEQTLFVPPGDREFKVEVSWEDEARSKKVSASLDPDSRRTLLVKLGRLRKNLSVEWQ